MPPSPYSFVLNQIRLGHSQVESYELAIARFSDYAPQRVYSQWLSAWVGKHTATAMMMNTGTTLFDYLSQSPSSNTTPPIHAPPGEIIPWFAKALSSPFDMQLVARVVSGRFSEFGVWRYEMRDNDTYIMIKREIEGLIVKEYLKGSKGRIDEINAYIIGVPRDL